MLVRPVRAIRIPVAFPPLRNALAHIAPEHQRSAGCGIALFVGQIRASHLIRSIQTVRESIAQRIHIDAHPVRAGMLMFMTSSSAIITFALHLIRTIAAIHVFIASSRLINTLALVCAHELIVLAVQLLGLSSLIASLLVRSVCAVLVPVASLADRQTLTAGTLELAVDRIDAGRVLRRAEDHSRRTDARRAVHSSGDANMRAAAILLHAGVIVSLQWLTAQQNNFIGERSVRWLVNGDLLGHAEVVLVGPIETLRSVASPENAVAYDGYGNRQSKEFPEQVAGIAFVAGELYLARTHVVPVDRTQIAIDDEVERSVAAESFLDNMQVRSTAGHVQTIDVGVRYG